MILFLWSSDEKMVEILIWKNCSVYNDNTVKCGRILVSDELATLLPLICYHGHVCLALC
jgi:hypothetical protein